MSEPGLDLHEWATRWQELQEQFEEDADGTLPAAVDFIERLLDEAGFDLEEPLVVQEESRDFVTTYRSVREVADRIERGEDVDPGDVGQAIEDLRLLYESVTVERPS